MNNRKNIKSLEHFKCPKCGNSFQWYESECRFCGFNFLDLMLLDVAMCTCKPPITSINTFCIKCGKRVNFECSHE